MHRSTSLTASVVRNFGRLADRCIAARASREGSGECDDKPSAHRRDRVGNVPFGPDRRRLWVGNPREWQIARAARRSLILRGEGAAFGDQKAVGGDTECGVVMEAAPAAPFIITQAELLLELLVI